MRTWLTFAAAVFGAVLLAAGVLDYTEAWLFVAGGAVTALAGLLALGGRGAVPLVVAGGWLLLSAFVGWDAQWNAFVGGILLVATGFLATAVGPTEPRGGAAG